MSTRTISHSPPNYRTRRRAPRDRRGAAVIEFAACIPVIVLLVLGSIEATSYIFLKQALQTAAYEGTREAIRIVSDNERVADRVENILSSRNIRDAQIRFPLGNADAVPRGNLIAVEVSAPTHTNSPLSGRFLLNRTLTVRTVMVKE